MNFAARHPRGNLQRRAGRGVAENTLGMIIAGLKGYFPCRDWTRAGHWSDAKLGTDNFIVREPFDVTIGIIGASKVGRYLMKLLQSFEVEILVYDPFFSEAEADELGVQSVSLENLMGQSDVVTLHAPVRQHASHAQSETFPSDERSRDFHQHGARRDRGRRRAFSRTANGTYLRLR